MTSFIDDCDAQPQIKLLRNTTEKNYDFVIQTYEQLEKTTREMIKDRTLKIIVQFLQQGNITKSVSILKEVLVDNPTDKDA